nr:hypothetical protein [Tanacetum cinerariifolium]
MACMKLGSKADAFQKQGQAWFCTTGLPSDIVVEVEDMSFHLHKFPLLSRSGVMEKLIAEASGKGDRDCTITLDDIPGGSRTFELVAKFCYGVKHEITASNVVHLRCAAEHLEMTEEYGEDNLISQTEIFFNQVVLKNWKDSLKALQTCVDLPHAEDLNITKRCIESLSVKASTDPNLFGWPVIDHGGPMQSPGGSVLWNGISTGARPKTVSSDWWFLMILALEFYAGVARIYTKHDGNTRACKNAIAAIQDNVTVRRIEEIDVKVFYDARRRICVKKYVQNDRPSAKARRTNCRFSGSFSTRIVTTGNFQNFK